MMEFSDSQLAQMAGGGDADAYRRLFERYQHPVYNFVYRMVDNAEDASDIVQDAFIKVYNALADQKEVRNFSAYLYRTAKNLAYDEMRRRSRFADVDHEVLAPEDPNIYADPQRALLLSEQMDKVRNAADGLNEKQRAALILKELEGLDYDSMSEVMESNRNAIGALLSRARLRFREELRMAQIPTEQVPEECEGIIALLSPYIDGELSDGEVAEVESHLDHCTFCAAALEEMEEASRSFRIFIPVIPPADMAEAFTQRLADAAQAAVGAGEAGQQQAAGGSEQTAVQTAATAAAADEGGRSLLSRVVGSRLTMIVAAMIAAAGMIGFLLAEEAGRDGGIVDAIIGEDGEVAEVAIDFQPVEALAPVHPSGILLPENGGPRTVEETDTREEEERVDETVTEQTPPAEEPGQAPAELPQASSGSILSGYASPNPVYDGNPLAITVVVSGSPKSVSVNIGGVMTVPLARQSSGASGEVWSWSGYAPSYGEYQMTARASYGTVVTRPIGTLTVWYYLY